MKKIVRKIIIALSFAGLLSGVACKKYDEVTGPTLLPASESFAVDGDAFGIATAPANFNLSNSHFLATFNEEVTWKITVTGNLSGAVKVISGTSDAIDLSNSEWDGRSDNHYFFRKNENCNAVLTFVGTDLSYSNTFSISNTKQYDGLDQNGIRYTLIDDFDTRGVAMSGIGKDLFDPEVTMSLDTNIKCHGKFSFKMSGKDFNNNSWCGGINHNTLTEIYVAGKTPTITDASDFYINMYVYGSGKPNTSIEIKVYEVDSEENMLNIPTYVYEQNRNDSWIVDLPVTWTGWKLVSLNYANFIPAKAPDLGGSGNKIREPHRITGLGVSLLSLPEPGANVEFYIDMVTFTEGGPFRP